MKLLLKKETKAIDTIENQVKTAITSQKELEDMLCLLVQVKERSKTLEQNEKKITAPLLKGIKSARDLFRPLRERYRLAEIKIKDLIKNYKGEIAQKTDEIVKKVEGGEMKIQEASVITKDLEEMVDGIKVRRIKKVVILDKNLIPRDYFILDEVRLRRDVLNGIIVPGTEIKEEEIIL